MFKADEFSKCKTWFYRVNTFLACHDMEQVSRERHVNTGNVMRAIETKLSTYYESHWKEKLQAEFAVRAGINLELIECLKIVT